MMIDFGRLRHLSPPQIKVLQAANRNLRRSKRGSYVMPADMPINFAESLLPQLAVKVSQNPLRPRLLGCKVMGGENSNLWYSNITKRIETRPTYLRGGFARSLTKIERVLKNELRDCAVMTTKERTDRALANFDKVCLHTDPVPTTYKHLIVDEAHLFSKKLATSIGAATVDEQYKWIVSPHSEKASAKAILAMGIQVPKSGNAPSFGTMLTEPRSLAEGDCPICLDDNKRLVVVCANGHTCCTTCSPHLRNKCMMCRGKVKPYI